MKTLSPKAQKFMDRKPTRIGTVAGVRFYEHPELGDEGFLIVITRRGTIAVSNFWELPEVEDLDPSWLVE